MALSEHDSYELEEGYVLRRRVGFLNYPSNVEFSPDGEVFVASGVHLSVHLCAGADLTRRGGHDGNGRRRVSRAPYRPALA